MALTKTHIAGGDDAVSYCIFEGLKQFVMRYINPIPPGLFRGPVTLGSLFDNSLSYKCYLHETLTKG